jgi:hypothetical protein
MEFLVARRRLQALERRAQERLKPRRAVAVLSVSATTRE